MRIWRILTAPVKCLKSTDIQYTWIGLNPFMYSLGAAMDGVSSLPIFKCSWKTFISGDIYLQKKISFPLGRFFQVNEVVAKYKTLFNDKKFKKIIRTKKCDLFSDKILFFTIFFLLLRHFLLVHRAFLFFSQLKTLCFVWI